MIAETGLAALWIAAALSLAQLLCGVLALRVEGTEVGKLTRPLAILQGLMLAIAFAFTVRRRVLAGPPGAGRYRATAVVSLTLWFGVGLSGRWIAFY